ncbi:MFS general substrate transporter [Rickenella mellea]|uniref:MFS general substrate transporter n=1 Tax=Rickenella mellea TaxID=50990 RepID=A0A4Y7PF90_9AGAM|nr:MFS general substrate transporter [Rickenella mellea]
MTPSCPALPVYPTSELEKSVTRDATSSSPQHGNSYSSATSKHSKYITVSGAFLCLFCTFGQMNAFGTFQTWYEKHRLEQLSPSAISWIGSTQFCVFFLSGAPIGRLFDTYGPRRLLMLGTFLFVLSIMLVSIATEFWELLLAHGFLFGLGVGMLFYPSIAPISTHFIKYRATAIGIAMSGSSIGTSIIRYSTTIILNFLIHQRWCRIAPSYLSDHFGHFNLLITAALLSGVCCTAFWLCAKRLPAILAFSALYGCFSGAFISLVNPCVFEISHVSDMGSRMGLLYSMIAAPSLVGGPIAGALLARENRNNFTGMTVFAGIALLIGSLFIFVARLRIDQRFFARV